MREDECLSDLLQICNCEWDRHQAGILAVLTEKWFFRSTSWNVQLLYLGCASDVEKVRSQMHPVKSEWLQLAPRLPCSAPKLVSPPAPSHRDQLHQFDHPT